MKKWIPALGIAGAVILAGLFLFLRFSHKHKENPIPENSVALASNRLATNDSLRAQAGSNQTSSNGAVNALSAPAAPTSQRPGEAVLSNTTPRRFLFGSADTGSNIDPSTVLGNMRNVIARYGSQFGGNPVGTNPEITAALNGENPKQVKFLTEDSGLRINGQGELVDSWGTPFFFHQISGTEMEIRSAGPDRKMWTGDDLVTK
jgi:hypothetical protein